MSVTILAWWRWAALRLGLVLLSATLWWGQHVYQANMAALTEFQRTVDAQNEKLVLIQQRLAMIEFEARLTKYRYDWMWRMVNRMHPGLLTNAPEP